MTIERPVFVTPIGGTNAWAPDLTKITQWWQNGSYFMNSLKKRNVVILRPEMPFIWTYDLDGLEFWLRWFKKQSKVYRDHRDWIAGGAAIHYYWRDVPLYDRNAFLHSHALQPMLYYLKFWGKANNIISLCSPLRADMDAVAEEAKDNCKHWLHIEDEDRDDVQVAGEIGDGRIGNPKYFAHKVLKLKGIDHSNLLHDPKLEHLLDDHKILDYLRL